MIDLTTIDDDTLMARGAYSTINAKLKDEKITLSKLCGEMHTIATNILAHVQPGSGKIPTSVAPLLQGARNLVDQIESCTDKIISMEMQKSDLYMQAWGEK